MNLIRTVLTLLFIWIAWFFIKNYLVKQQRDSQSANQGLSGKAGSDKSRSTTRISVKTVKCRLCEVHLPEDAAVKSGSDWFCGQPHKQAWLEKR